MMRWTGEGRKILLESLLVTAVCAVISILLAAYRSWDDLSFEACAFIRVYNGAAGNSLRAVFDPVLTDWGAYQGRELSYLVDLIDSRFIAFCIRRGMAHFYAVSGFVLLWLTVFCQQYFIRKHFPRSGGMLPLLFSLFYILDPATANYRFFRSAKPGVALLVTFALFSALDLFRHRGRRQQGGWWVTGVALFAASLFDRQGYIFTVAWAGTALAAALADGDKRLSFWRNCAVTGTAAAAAATLYDLLLAPLMIKALNGTYPDFSYQSLGGCSGSLQISSGVDFVTGHFGHAFTALPGTAAVVSGAALLIFLFWRTARGRGGFRMMFLLLGAAVGMVLTASVMAARHPGMLSVEYGVYNLVFFTVFMYGLLAVAGMERNAETGRRWLTVLLLTGIICTMLFAPPWKRVKDPSDMRVAATRQLIRTLNNGGRGGEEKRPLPFPMYKLAEYFADRRK